MWFLQFLPSDWSRDLGLICQQVLLVAGTAPDSEVFYLPVSFPGALGASGLTGEHFTPH